MTPATVALPRPTKERSAGARAASLVSARVDSPSDDRGITPAVLTLAGARARRRPESRSRPEPPAPARRSFAAPPEPGDPAWEAAYERFETPAREVRKVTRRLRWFGAPAWARGSHVVELFCARGNGLVAFERLGFRRLTGVDLSPTLLANYDGLAQCIVADCRALPLERQTADVVVVQGGLHRLGDLPGDLDAVLEEIRRVLVPNGRVVVVEPWSTPFRTLLDAGCASKPLRRLSGRLDALATMIEHERTTYEAWLAQPDMIRARLERHFNCERTRVRRGELFFLGRATAVAR